MNVRDQAITNLGGFCRSCFSKDDLQLNHIAYLPLSVRYNVKSDYWKRAREALEYPERFELLCKKCHVAHHHKKDYIKSSVFHIQSSMINAETLKPRAHSRHELRMHVEWMRRRYPDMKITIEPQNAVVGFKKP